MTESNNMKLKDYFKQAENIIEDNLKILTPCMLIYMLFSAGVMVLSIRMGNSGAIQLDNEAQVSSLLLTTAVTTLVMGILRTILEIFILLKIDTELDFVEDKRVNGSVPKIIGRLILANLIYFAISVVVVSIISIIYVMLLSINEALGNFSLAIMMIPMFALSVIIPIAMYYLNFEIIVKDTKIIKGFKAVYKNIMKSKNKTLSKLLVGAGVQTLAFIAIQIFTDLSGTGGQSFIAIILIGGLQAAYVVYFLVYYFIVYMSSEA